jgi:hypothetical protein
MATIKTDGLTPMQLGRVAKILEKLERREGVVRKLCQHIEAGQGVKTETDGMCDYNRHTFNRMNEKEQRAYEARLKARRYYMVDGYTVPKIIYDLVQA